MGRLTTVILEGAILEEEVRLSLRELCEACAVDADFVRELVDEGLLEPAWRENSRWSFSGVSLWRVRTARHLQRDLGINLAGVALALELLDEVEKLRARLNRLSERGQG